MRQAGRQAQPYVVVIIHGSEKNRKRPLLFLDGGHLAMPMPCSWLCDDSTELFAVRRDTPPESLTSACLFTYLDKHPFYYYIFGSPGAAYILASCSQGCRDPTGYECYCTVRCHADPHLHYLSIGLRCRRLGTQIFFLQSDSLIWHPGMADPRAT